MLKDYLLFIDTETTGIPKRWDLPYTNLQNWPSAVQISWIIYTKNGEKVKSENVYINTNGLDISPESFKIHGITSQFLQTNGKSRTLILQQLAQDIKHYKPLIIGHFVEFDIHTLSCDYQREQLVNPFLDAHFFCTMLSTKKYVQNPKNQYLRLPQLCETLFEKTENEFHNAEFDALCTAKCFFELKQRNDILTQDFDKNNQDIISKLNFKTL